MNKLLVGVAFAVFALGTSPAAAQAVSPPPGVAQGTTPVPVHRVHTPPIIRSPVQVMGMTGAVITRDEFVRQVRAAFERADVNHDGYVTRSEVAARRNRMLHEMHAGMTEGFRERAGVDGGHRMAMPDPAMMFDRLDTNHDGVISRQEFMAAHAGMHERRMLVMHARDDMTNSHAHNDFMRSHMPRMGEDHGMHFLAHLFERSDANRDGRVTLKEAETAALAHFDRMDLNHDGRLTADERRAAHARMGARRPS
ncbi:MAG TPA: EF-hand domain-containing protein [Sphingomicrobium sp.]|nr:EF-hand domain-containing protein [Sphingomicrobium sp.]